MNITNPALGNNLQVNGVSFVNSLLPALISLIIIVGAVAFLFMLLTGGIQWITSGGDKAAVETARGRITHAVIGLVILLGAFAIISLISTFFSVNLLFFSLSSLQIGG